MVQVGTNFTFGVGDRIEPIDGGRNIEKSSNANGRGVIHPAITNVGSVKQIIIEREEDAKKDPPQFPARVVPPL